MSEQEAVTSGETSPSSTAMLKAMANPIRRDLLNTLIVRRFARATDLAEALSLPANKVSFHLRVLADAGLIEEDPDRARDRRDRVWKPSKTRLQFGDPGTSREDQVLAQAMIASLMEEHQELVRRVMTYASEKMESGSDEHFEGKAATFSHARVYLTEQQFAEVIERIEDIVEQAGAHDIPDDSTVQSWQIDIVAGGDHI